MKNKSLVLGISIVIVGIVLAIILPADSTKANEHETDDHVSGVNEGMVHSHNNVPPTYGPGLGPHALSISLMQFETKADIAQSPVASPLQYYQAPRTVHLLLEAKEVVSEIAPDVTYLYWTYNGSVPGPFLRVREGDIVELTLSNHESSSHTHSIDLHAVNGPGGGSTLTQVVPGENKTFTFTASNPGLYVYHCATHNVPTHIANGMYGLIMVEPKKGLPEVDKEFYVMQGELYTRGMTGEQGYQSFSASKMQSEDPDYIVFNGRVNGLVENKLQAQTGETVRIYVGNGGVAKSSAFHVIGEIFDEVYPEAAMNPVQNVQTTSIPPGGASIVDFTVDVPGTYILVDHALARIDKGGWGLLEVEGEQDTTFGAVIQ